LDTYPALCIVGGATTGERKIAMWDWVHINGRLTASSSITGNQHFNKYCTLYSTTIAGS
jgi:hypothetical protein